MKNRTFICECNSLEHQVTFWYDPEDKEVYATIHLVTHKNFFKRVASGIKYMFGYKSRYGNWDSFIFKDKDIKSLKEYLKNEII